MNLVLDIGNTRIKAALFERDVLKETGVFDSVNSFHASALFDKHAVAHCIIGSVVNEMESFIMSLQKKCPVLVFSSDTPTPLKNLYRSAHPLGSDRLAAAVGGNTLFPNEHVLVIDAGTCIKYNFVNSNNEYIGGAIAPGLEMRLKALHTFTSRLPLLKVDEDYNTLVGTNSVESILSGAQGGAVAEMEGCIALYRQQYPDIKVVITGGDVNFFEKRLKNSIFADEYLILKGLNIILEYNLKVSKE